MQLNRISLAMAVVAGGAFAVNLPAWGQEVPRSFAASPGVYKVIAENDTHRVIAATWRSGQRDNWHSHGAVVAVYALTGCNLRLHTADGKYRDAELLAGESRVGPQAPSHVAENTGSADCRMILFEPK